MELYINLKKNRSNFEVSVNYILQYLNYLSIKFTLIENSLCLIIFALLNFTEKKKKNMF